MDIKDFLVDRAVFPEKSPFLKSEKAAVLGARKAEAPDFLALEPPRVAKVYTGVVGGLWVLVAEFVTFGNG